MRFILAALLALVPVLAGAQNSVPTFSHGPTASAFSIRFSHTETDALDAHFGMLSEGLGYSLNLNNVVGSEDGSMSWVGVKFPLYPHVFDSEFALGIGAELSFFNNLVGIGAAVDAVNTATDRGFILGTVDAEDVMVTISFGFNLGSGAAPTVARVGASKAAMANVEESSPPFNFVSLRR